MKYKFEEYHGKQFNMLTVVREGKNAKGKRAWLCRCSCGNDELCAVEPLQLISGKRKSCRCQQFKGNRKGDQKYVFSAWQGKRRNELTPVREVYKNDHRFWLCRCSCGKETHVTPANFCNDGQKSCGCLNNRIGPDNPHWTGIGELSGGHFSEIRSKAVCRKIKFDVSKEYLWELYSKREGRCALSNLPIALATTRKGRHTASLDRIDSKRGYEVGNVQWVHKDINWMKNRFSQARFIELCKAVAANS